MELGWGTLAYGMTAGLLFGLALIFLLNGARARRFDALMMSLGVYSFSLGLATIVTVRLHNSTSVSDYANWVQVSGLIGLLAMVALVVLVEAWTASISRTVLLILGGATVVIAILQLTTPNGLLVGDIDGLRQVELFGESLVVHEGSASPLRPVLDVYLLAVVAIVAGAIVRGYRSGLRTHAALMGATLVVATVFSFYDSLVDFGIAETSYLLPFGALGTAIAGAMYLAERSLRTELRLVEQTTTLEETVVERTAALIETNRQLETQLTRQRTSTRNLTALAHRFEMSNTLVDPSPATTEQSLSSLLEGLGTMVSATDVELRIIDEHVEGVLTRSMSWRRPPAFGEHGQTDRLLDDAADAFTVVRHDIRIGTKAIGRLTANIADDQREALDAAPYLELAAEHLSGLFHRLDVVAQIADSAVEEERQRIAMELHDSVTQRMYSVSFLADAAVHQAAAGSAELAELVERIRELVLSSLAELRILLLELRPNALVDTELHELLEQLAHNTESTCDAEIVIDATSTPPISTETKTALYRISQEAISNACRHANADEITLRLLHDDDEITLAICDDGVGFDPDSVIEGDGLRNLRARAHRIGALIEIASQNLSGTAVTVRLDRPVAAATRPAAEKAQT